MGRKRNKGKARRAAKAIAREEAAAAVESNDDQDELLAQARAAKAEASIELLKLDAAEKIRKLEREIAKNELDAAEEKRKLMREAVELEQRIAELDDRDRDPQAQLDLRLLDFGGRDNTCLHGGKISPFAMAVDKSFFEYYAGDCALIQRLDTAFRSTASGFADDWSDSSKIEGATSYFCSNGVFHILEGRYNIARAYAAMAEYLEQLIAVEIEQSQAQIRWNQIIELSFPGADLHTLVNFFRERIPCSCLNEKYEEVKSITRLCLCHNEQCRLPGGKVERSKSLCCGRCRSVTYCSRECQKSDWKRHKKECGAI